MKRRNPRDRCRRVGRLRQIFVTFQPNCNANLTLHPQRQALLKRGGANDAQDMALAPHRHAVAQRDLRGHAERKFDLGTFDQGSVGEKENSARAQVLSEPNAFNGTLGLTQGNRQQVRESLSNAAFNLDWRSGHKGFLLPIRQNSAGRYFSAHRVT
jgi:hypothetical protein